MWLECRMSANSGKPSFLNELFKNAGNAVKKVTNTVSGTNPSNGISKPPVPPVTSEPTTIPPMKGGMAPVNYRVAHMQPSEAVMKWATTAGAAMPAAAQMRGVAHGGRRARSGRKTIHRRYRKSKRATGGRRRKTHMRKTYRKRRN